MADFRSLLQTVVQRGFCVGCGVCASQCPKNLIIISQTPAGQYTPQLKNGGECTACGRCVSVCPFYFENHNEDFIGEHKFRNNAAFRHTPETGFFTDTFVGYADDKTRINGASGGALSYLLKAMLSNEMIDGIITVEPHNDPRKLFKYTVINSVEGIERCAKSAYYPVELSEVLSVVKKEEKRYVLVGLPCVIKAVELARIQDPTLRKTIVYTLGLVCGQSKTQKYTEYLITQFGVPVESVTKVTYRKKVADRPSSDYAFEIETNDGTTLRKLWSEGVNTVWCNDFFKQKSCYFCDDVFAECADASFMDAWLPPYSTDYRGHSLVIGRNSEITQLFTQSWGFEPIGVNEIIKSQKPALINKRGKSVQLFRTQTKVPVPQTRNFDSIDDSSRFAAFRRKYKNSQLTRSGDDSLVFKSVTRLCKNTIYKRIHRKFIRLISSK
ncbi:Coenzyme F420 hydrogenase/dehydrogenase, beta subunit C-terminal domain [Chitinispirillales bacterium ANBcel5]|uniref:Coenzyme F420 hydrogenase/dehydrogenase, beta subunit C-terminal domain n=1 Tax=Cellulosispirillum alkaliphilum TaxID=3039283 RepID=UPI002A5592EA|nr:Coenzyme F420 hydrogenase/dehydrogenase, beta subunit C-terminal domain [Chitinispirillales bacterium ANBcel5]